MKMLDSGNRLLVGNTSVHANPLAAPLAIDLGDLILRHLAQNLKAREAHETARAYDAIEACMQALDEPSARPASACVPTSSRCSVQTPTLFLGATTHPAQVTVHEASMGGAAAALASLAAVQPDYLPGLVLNTSADHRTYRVRLYIRSVVAPHTYKPIVVAAEAAGTNPGASALSPPPHWPLFFVNVLTKLFNVLDTASATFSAEPTYERCISALTGQAVRVVALTSQNAAVLGTTPCAISFASTASGRRYYSVLSTAGQGASRRLELYDPLAQAGWTIRLADLELLATTAYVLENKV